MMFYFEVKLLLMNPYTSTDYSLILALVILLSDYILREKTVINFIIYNDMINLENV